MYYDIIIIFRESRVLYLFTFPQKEDKTDLQRDWFVKNLQSKSF